MPCSVCHRAWYTVYQMLSVRQPPGIARRRHCQYGAEACTRPWWDQLWNAYGSHLGPRLRQAPRRASKACSCRSTVFRLRAHPQTPCSRTTYCRSPGCDRRSTDAATFCRPAVRRNRGGHVPRRQRTARSITCGPAGRNASTSTWVCWRSIEVLDGHDDTATGDSCDFGARHRVMVGCAHRAVLFVKAASPLASIDSRMAVRSGSEVALDTPCAVSVPEAANDAHGSGTSALNR